jgi:hypothetical protein
MRTIFLPCILFFFLITCKPDATPDEQTSVSESEASNNIRHYLSGVAARISSRSLKDYHSIREWESERGDKLLQFQQMVSLVNVPLNEERPPLNTKTTGTIQMDGYRIEKLYYESLPSLYVPANLYIPDNIQGQAPAILYLCGHSRTQKVHYQAHAHKFAKLGFVCLIVETIQYGEVWGEHWGCYANGWFHWYSRGYTPAGVEVWNAIRGFDLLEKRPEVDTANMGVTGISGGGAQAWFMAALDPRVKAVAPVCGASTLEAQIGTRTIDGHCDCMMINNTYGWDIPDIGALIAPRPLLIAQADRDGLNQIESVRQIYDQLYSFYELYQHPENILYIETPGGHSYHSSSRKLINAFFMKHLMGKNATPEEAGDIDESEDVLLSEEELKVYVEDPPEDDRTKTIQDSFIRLPDPPIIKNKEQLTQYRDTVRRFLSNNTFHSFPDNPPSFDSVLVFRTLDRAANGSRIYSFISEEGWRLKIDIRYRAPVNQKNPLLIVLRNPGEDRWSSEGFVSALNDHWNIAYLEVRGIGEFGWAPELQWHVRRASAWTGRTLASMQVYDLLRAITFCRTLDDIDPAGIGLAARGDMAVVAFYGALLDGKCQTVIVKDPPPTQNAPSSPDGRGSSIEMLNCLQVTDVNQIPALLFPAEIVFIGDMPREYEWADQTQKNVGLNSFQVISTMGEL